MKYLIFLLLLSACTQEPANWNLAYAHYEIINPH